MKVLQITTNYPTKEKPIFGIFMKEQVDSLEKFGVENTIFFSNGSLTNVGKKNGGMKVHLKSALKLFFHLLTHRYDLIHCHSNVSGLILYFSGWAFFRKCIISFQNDPRVPADSTHFKMLYKVFNKVIVKLPVYLDKKKIVYLPNGCNTDFFKPMDRKECREKLGLDPDKKYILFMDSNTSRGRTQKRRDRFDAVLRILRDKYKLDDVEVIELTNTPREQVPTYINASDLHLLTSDQEGSPNSVKECMACNVPVVSTNVGNVEDLLKDVPCCFISYSFEPEDLAEKVYKVFTYKGEKDLRKCLFEKGLDSGHVSERLYGIYNEVTSKKHRS